MCITMSTTLTDTFRKMTSEITSVTGVNRDGACDVRKAMIDETPTVQLVDGNPTQAPRSHVLCQAAY